MGKLSNAIRHLIFNKNIRGALLKKATSLIATAMMLLTPLMTSIGSAQAQTVQLPTSTQNTLQGLFGNVISNQILADYNTQPPLFRAVDMVKSVFPTIPGNLAFSPEYREAVTTILVTDAFLTAASKTDLVLQELQKRNAELQAFNVNDSLTDITASLNSVVTSQGLLKATENLTISQKEEIYKSAWGQVAVDTGNLLVAITDRLDADQVRASGIEELEANTLIVNQAVSELIQQAGLRGDIFSKDSFKKVLISSAELLGSLIESKAYADVVDLFKIGRTTVTFDTSKFGETVAYGAGGVLFVAGVITLAVPGAVVGGGAVAAGGGIAAAGGATATATATAATATVTVAAVGGTAAAAAAATRFIPTPTLQQLGIASEITPAIRLAIERAKAAVPGTRAAALAAYAAAKAALRARVPQVPNLPLNRTEPTFIVTTIERIGGRTQEISRAEQTVREALAGGIDPKALDRVATTFNLTGKVTEFTEQLGEGLSRLVRLVGPKVASSLAVLGVPAAIEGLRSTDREVAPTIEDKPRLLSPTDASARVNPIQLPNNFGAPGTGGGPTTGPGGEVVIPIPGSRTGTGGTTGGSTGTSSGGTSGSTGTSGAGSVGDVLGGVNTGGTPGSGGSTTPTSPAGPATPTLTPEQIGEQRAQQLIDNLNKGIGVNPNLGATGSNPPGAGAPQVTEGSPLIINGVIQGGTPVGFTPSGEAGDSIARQFTDAVVNFIQGGVKQPAPAKITATGGGAVTLNPDASPQLPTTVAGQGGSVVDPGPTPTSTSSGTVALPPKDLQPVSLDTNIGGSVIGQDLTDVNQSTAIDSTQPISTFTKGGTSLTSITSIDSNIAQVSPIRCGAGYTDRDIVPAEPVPSFCNGNVVCSTDNAAGCNGFVCEFTGGTCSEGLVMTTTAVGQYICKAPEKVCSLSSASTSEVQSTTCNTDAIQAALATLNEKIVKASDGSTGFTAKEGTNLCQPGYELALGFINSTESFGYFCNASPLNVCNASGTRLAGTSSTEACCAF